MPSESEHSRELSKRLQAIGALVYPLIGSTWQPTGWPDRYVSHTSWRGFLEFKTDNGKLRADQRKVIGDLLLRGDSVWLVRFDSRQKDPFPCILEFPLTYTLLAEITSPAQLLRVLSNYYVNPR